MSSDQILSGYLVIFALYFAFDLGLNLLNLRYVQARGDAVPDYFKDWISLEGFRKSVLYTIEKQRLAIIELIFSASLLLLCIFSGFFGYADRLAQSFSFGQYITGCIFIFGLATLSSLLRLPISYYSQFSIEERYGFNTMTLGIWLSDMGKAFLLQLVLGVPVLVGLFYLIDVLGPQWWLYGFLFIAVIQLTLFFLFPVLIAPLFNKFSPLDEASLRDQIFALAEKARFKTAGIFVMDGSRRSKHGNAYFTGLGRYKRIVLFDTLIDLLKEREVLAVLAHEIGHEKKKHILKSMTLSLAMLFVGFWVLSVIINYQPLFEAFGFTRTSAHGALLLVGFVFEPILFFIGPLFSMLSRRHEFEADRFAVDLVQSSADLRTALLSLSGKSLSNLVPHPLFSFFHYSHPTLSERLPAMDEYAKVKGFTVQ